MKNILVTVCITTYNRDDILPETIKSVQNQTYNKLEIIIVDDCSTDNTEKLIKQYIKKDKRIKYIKYK